MIIIAEIVLGGITCGACGRTHTDVAAVVACHDVIDELADRGRDDDRLFAQV